MSIKVSAGLIIMTEVTKISVGISLPKEFLKRIDIDRGDISRSRYITKFFENYYVKNAIGKKNKIGKNRKEKMT